MTTNSFRLQILITQRCNALCLHCDKAVGYKKMPDINFTARDANFAVRLIKSQGVRIRWLTISGGEPILNPQLQEILNELDRLSSLRVGRILSNGLRRTEEARTRIVLPGPRWHWKISQLDDIDDPLSGKNRRDVRVRNRFHQPLWISPADHGLEATFEKCGVRGWCGIGLDGKGFSMCGQAPILGRILGLNPYPRRRTADIRKHVLTPIPEICKHCVYGLTKTESRAFRKRVYEGEIPDLSPTFQRRLDGPQLANHQLPVLSHV